ncbi:MATE family efflux transporter [Arcanobacterium hippocoleae]|uniref:MATE family efflux transporter n=1 Tax=Arcanobacterium hippocoleae TaxID=149017 RepID=UPI0036706ECA
MDRKIIHLALTSLGTLLVEPLLVAVDSTMIGRLGTTELAGLSLASAVLTTIVGLCIFLTYATTAATARAFGAGKKQQAARLGIDGIWLAAALGGLLWIFIFLFATPILQLFGPQPQVLPHAVGYLQASAAGLPGMLLVLATTGALRGFTDARTPLIASTFGACLNIPLNIAFIYIWGFGVTGAGIGTAIAQNLMGAFLTWRFARIAKKVQANLGFSGSGVFSSLRASFPLLVRTISLRTALLAQIAAATALGTLALAANQIVFTMWNFAAYGLDSLAIAAQIMIGQSLGNGDKQSVKTILQRCISWSWRAGILLGFSFACFALFIPQLMSFDAKVQLMSRAALWLIALSLPISALTYLLDGVLIGAGDTKKLAKYMLIALFSFLPFAAALIQFGPRLALHFATPTHAMLPDGMTLGMLLLWAAYALIFMGVRAATMYRRIKDEAWMHLS